MTKTYFNCEVTFEENSLSRNILKQLEEKFEDIKNWEDCHSNFDCIDSNGAIADVYLFQKDNKLFVRGQKFSRVLRNPENVYEFLTRNKRIKKITLVYRPVK